MIAEDEALIRLDLKEMLEEEGYEIAGEASDGQQAVELAEKLHPDLLILDVKMPVLDGISAAEQIAAKHVAPVVILTAFSQRELVERARDAGAMAYLVKPFTKADLVPAIEIAVSRFQELSALGAEVGTLRERLEVRKLLDRAKGRLQVDGGLTEPELRAHDPRRVITAGPRRGLPKASKHGRPLESPGPPLVPCRPSPGRHVLYSAAPGSRHHRSERQPGGAKASTFPGQNAVNVRSCVVSPRGAGHARPHAWLSAQPVPVSGPVPVPGAPGAAWPGTRSMRRQVSREVQTRRPASSLMTIS